MITMHAPYRQTDGQMDEHNGSSARFVIMNASLANKATVFYADDMQVYISFPAIAAGEASLRAAERITHLDLQQTKVERRYRHFC